MVKERAYLLINTLLGDWHTKEDLSNIMQCTYRSVDRYMTLLMAMLKTNELDKLILDVDYIDDGRLPRFRMRIK